MKYRSPIPDYQPLRRTAEPEGQPSEIDNDISSKSKQPRTAHSFPEDGNYAEPVFSSAARPTETGVGKTTNFADPIEQATEARWDALKPPSKSSTENWIRAHGHSVSFIGLFLFTFVLYFRPYEWSPALSWLSSSAFWIAVVTLAVFIPTQLGLENKITARPREINLALLLTLAGLLSVPFALEPPRAWNSFVEYLKIIAMFIVMVNVVRTEKRLKILILLVIVVSCVLSLAAIADYRSGQLILRGTRIEGAIGGLFDNPNDLALHLVTIVPIATVLGIATRNPLKKLFYASCALLFASGIVVTFSRGGFLGLFFAVGMLAWKLARRHKILFMVVGIGFLLGAIILVPGAYRSRLSTTDDESALARTDDLKRSLFIAARHPLLGVGMGNYILYSNFNKTTHNAYTQVAAELGLAGALFYVGFLMAPFKSLRRIERRQDTQNRLLNSSYYAIGLQASLIGYMVCSFFASVAFQWYVYYLVAYAICLQRLAAAETDVGSNGQQASESG